VIEEEKLCERAIQIGASIVERLKAMQNNHPQKIGNIRNLGAMIAMELVHEGDANRPDADLTKALVAEAAKNGLILLSCGIRGNVIRFLPALTISDELISESMDRLEQTLAAVL
jgi:4-aminobutyrate aminotransferase/(S)-3-amino-2-methylpropionate transaminase